jgi:hypothetical protein
MNDSKQIYKSTIKAVDCVVSKDFDTLVWEIPVFLQQISILMTLIKVEIIGISSLRAETSI